jgi:hypothetical protein
VITVLATSTGDLLSQQPHFSLSLFFFFFFKVPRGRYGLETGKCCKWAMLGWLGLLLDAKPLYDAG